MTGVLDFLSQIWPYLFAVLMFLILVIIHEFGHFIAAKILGVRVNGFSVGLGPKLFSKKIGETEYKISALPFGGYCAMEGEDENSTDTRAFCNKKAWRRFLIVVMGAVFNILFGVLLVGIVVCSSELIPTVTVAKFTEDSVSEQSGLMVNDTFYSVNGRRIYTADDLNYAFTGVDESGELEVEVVRNGEITDLGKVSFNTEKEDNGINYVSIDFWIYGEEKTFFGVIAASFKTAFSYCRIIFLSLMDFFAGKYGLSSVVGPVGLTAEIGKVVKTDISAILRIMSLISINLGLFNLLPLPALDGGRLLFIFIEMVTGKKVSQKYEGAVHLVGFVILMIFMVLITFKDIFKLITG